MDETKERSTVKDLKDRLSELPNSYELVTMTLKVKNPKFKECITIEYSTKN